MTTTNKCSGLKVLDPVQGLVDYIGDIKPYHTKIVEVLVEYVYGEALDVIIDDSIDTQIDLFRPETDDVLYSCERGYSLLPWGAPRGGWPIVSPDQTLTDAEYNLYPAFDSSAGRVIIPGDRSNDIRPGDQVEIVAWIENPILSPPNDNRPDTSGVFNKLFTVSAVEYNAGSIPEWPDITDPSTYRLGVDPHTIITLLEGFGPLPLPLPYPDDVYIAMLRLAPVEIERVYSYSNAESTYTSSPLDFSQTPDEGYLRRDIESVVLSSLDGFGVAIPDTGKITVGGNLLQSNIFVNDIVNVYGSSGNNGQFTIASLAYDAGNDQTTIGVVERIYDAVPDGSIRIDVPSNVFVVDGNYSSRFHQGRVFNVAGGSFAGQYTTLTSDYVGGKTRIRTTTDIVNNSSGPDIMGVVKEAVFGFGETSDLCINVPGTTVRIKFDEQLTFDGLGLDLDDDMIVYNMENSDAGGYEIPLTTVINATPPTVSEGTTYWLDSNSKLLYYRTKTAYVDTNWVLFLAEPPGFSDNQPAVGGVDYTVTGSMFTGSPPAWEPYDWTYETNAHVGPFGHAPHQVFHDRVSVEGSPAQAYVLYGGNYVHRMIPQNRLSIYDFDLNGGLLDIQQPLSLGVWSVDPVAHEITVDGLYGWFFTSGVIMSVLMSDGSIEDLKVVASTELTNTTVVEVVEDLIGSSTRLVDHHFTTGLEWDVYEIDNVGDAVIVNGDYRLTFPDGSFIKVFNSTAGNTDVVWTVQSTSYDPVNGRTVIYVNEDIPDPDPHTSTTAVVVPADLPTHEVVFGAVYDPNVDHSDSNDNVKTYIIPSAIDSDEAIAKNVPGSGMPYPAADGMSYLWYGPLRVELAMRYANAASTAINDHLDMSDQFVYDDPTSGHPNDQTVDSAITDDLNFGWGSSYQWEIIGTNSTSSTIDIQGDVSSIVNVGDLAHIIGSQGNDGDYIVLSVVYDLPNNKTVIALETTGSPVSNLPVDPPTGLEGYFRLEDIDITSWYQYLIKEANSTTNVFTVLGNATLDVQAGMEFRVFGTQNDGIYTVTSSPIYDAVTNTTEIQVTSISTDENGGWIESYRDYGIRLILEDFVGMNITENTDAALILTSGSLIGALDYTYFDIGALDENATTVLHLYGNNF